MSILYFSWPAESQILSLYDIFFLYVIDRILKSNPIVELYLNLLN